MHSISARRFGMLVAALAVTAAPAMAAPDAASILKKSQAAMANVNSYQATWLMTMDMGQMGSMAMNMDMKMKPKSKMMSMKMSPAGTPTGQMAMAAGMMNMTMVADGKFMYMYMPMMGGYNKGPIQPQVFNPGSMAFQNTKQASFKYIRSQNLNGKPAHVIQVIPNPSMTRGAKANMLMFIDAASNRFKQMTMKMSGIGGANAPKGAPQTMNMKMVVQREVVNAAIPDSAFRFVPPPGAKELKGGPMGAGMSPFGGMMGGGAPRR